MTLHDEIRALAAQKKAIILAHNYQNPEIQDIADVTGDSLELARIAADNDAEIIVFCGVHFMAESAAMLSPEKKVLMPEPSAGCPMADMAAPEDVAAMKEEHPGAAVVTYINSTAAVKALSDVICTSSNAIKIVQSVEADEIIFIPDRNLGSYVQRFTDKKIILWDGCCPPHNFLMKDDLIQTKKQYPDALVMVHPECAPDVIEIADRVFSTGEMVKYVENSSDCQIIVGTEIGMIHKLKSVNSNIEYIPSTKKLMCPNMKKTDMQKLHDSLLNEKTVIIMDEETSRRARSALEKMLELSL